MPKASDYGLFVHRMDNLYVWDERLEGKTYKRATAAEKAATTRNANGEFGGMIVARPYSLMSGETASQVDAYRRRHRSLYGPGGMLENPQVTIMRANPASGDVVEVYRGVPIIYRGGRYYPDIVSATGSNVSMPNMQTLTAARRFVGFALKRGAVARDKWKPKVNGPGYNVAAGRRVRVKKNPAATRVAAVLSRRAYDLSYIHAEDKGQAYRHKFAPGVTVQLLSDGSVRLFRPDGKPIWKNFTN